MEEANGLYQERYFQKTMRLLSAPCREEEKSPGEPRGSGQTTGK